MVFALRTHFCTYLMRRRCGALKLPQMLKNYFCDPRQTATVFIRIAHWSIIKLLWYFYSNIVAFGIIIAQSIYSLLMRQFRGNIQTSWIIRRSILALEASYSLAISRTFHSIQAQLLGTMHSENGPSNAHLSSTVPICKHQTPNTTHKTSNANKIKISPIWYRGTELQYHFMTWYPCCCIGPSQPIDR